ncbi:hypothetical protein QOZ80_1BG0068340 [Eleusine coracana subsp. coracana]|nr:hypothetical protein QOZ80_1BG0068340 [Eleusine coracana subsp. coracana]
MAGTSGPGCEGDEWAMEIHAGTGSDPVDVGDAEDLLEIDLDALNIDGPEVFLAMAYYCSEKKFSPIGLFEELNAVWGVVDLAPVERVDTHMFMITFKTKEERSRVVDGGPWRHKGDVLFVVNYDGLTRPSEVVFDSLPMWIWLYDLPLVLRSVELATIIGNKIGKFIKTDLRFPGYLRVRVMYPIDKPLAPTTTIWLKGRGLMDIATRYENVPHFYFTCGRIGHAARECREGGGEELGVTFGEELQASPPKRMREITVRATGTRVARNLNFTEKRKENTDRVSSSSARPEAVPRQAMNTEVEDQMDTKGPHAPQRKNDLHPLDIKDSPDGWPNDESLRAMGTRSREWVLFGTNMITEEEPGESISVMNNEDGKTSAVDRFLARKFGGKTLGATKPALKIAGSGREIDKSRKVKSIVKKPIHDAIQSLMEQGMEEVANIKEVKPEPEEMIEE